MEDDTFQHFISRLTYWVIRNRMVSLVLEVRSLNADAYTGGSKQLIID